eukprot:jgi/Chrpa1/15563/Chrysochromulina_OHIO_Genome00019132-RA
MPGAVAYAMQPFRILAFSFFFTLMYPSSSSWASCVLCTCALPARYLRVVVGTPPQILKFGAYPMPKQSKKLPAAGEDGVGLITTSHKADPDESSTELGFQIMPAYNDDLHIMDRCLFMNSYGKRTMPTPFHTWNWKAPICIWLGVNTITNTIQVNGKTTTLVGSCMWGLEIVESLRDSMEVTLRDIMATKA